MADTQYADAVNMLHDAVEHAIVLAEGALTNREIADELRRLADEIEAEA